MRYGIEIEASRDGSVRFDEGTWLKTYEPEAHSGEGGFELTDDPAEALGFGNRLDALTEGSRVSTVRPCDNDGKLNRPLHAAFVFSVRELPEGKC